MTATVLLALPLGVLIGVGLGALGAGGSILTVPVLVFVAGRSPSSATTTSLLVVAIAAAVGAAAHQRAGRVHLRTGVTFGVIGFGGTLVGSMLNRKVEGDVLLLAFALLMMVAAWRIIAGCPSCTRAAEAVALAGARPAAMSARTGAAVHVDASAQVGSAAFTPAQIPKVVIAATVVGLVSGLFGVGGGFVVVPALTLVLGFSMPDAIGTSLLIVALNAGIAFAMRVATGPVDWATAATFAAAATAGTQIGSAFANRLDAKMMQRSFATVLVVVAVYTGTRAAVGVSG